MLSSEIFNLAILLIAPFVGIIIGLLPAIGAIITMIAFFPLLLSASPNVAICFYAMMLTASQFSGSVSAIWFGILGESTSIPVLQERKYIIENNLQLISLKYTSYSSIIAAIVSGVFLIFSLYFGLQNKWLLRTETLSFVLFLVLLFCILWPENKWYCNITLIFFGLFLGKIGFDPISKTEFLTFDNVYLYGGLPNMSVVLGLYAIPLLIAIYKKQYTFDQVNLKQETAVKFPIAASLRGSIIGFFSGLLPMIGTTISSNIAHFIEKKLGSNALYRITAAEAANNSAVISVLIPLLLFGLPIQPSEIILYEIITSNNWLRNSITIYDILFLMGCIFFTAVVSHLLCWTFVNSIAEWYKNNYKYIINAVIVIIICNVVFNGWQANQIWYYFAIFFIMSLIGMLLSVKVDLLPALMAFLLQDQFFVATNRLIELYF